LETGGADCDDIAVAYAADIIRNGGKPRWVFAGIDNEIYHVYCEDKKTGKSFDPYGSNRYRRIATMSVPQKKTKLLKTGGWWEDILERFGIAPEEPPPTPTQPGVPTETQNQMTGGFDIKAYLPYIVIGVIIWYFFFKD